jgi:hypothetical protein
MDSFQFIIPSDLRELKIVYAAESYYRPLSGNRPARFVAFFWVRVTVGYKTNGKRYIEQEKPVAKRIVNIRLRPDQEERINAIVERSAILDTSKFVRIAVDPTSAK